MGGFIFIDSANITVRAGDGGNGCVSFHRAKCLRSGGPDGGDGGKGGSVYFVPDANLSTLYKFRYKKVFKAENGCGGFSCCSSGKSGKDLFIRVPFGTLISDVSTNEILADICFDESKLVCKGGKGGWGNKHFTTSTRQAPRFAKPGSKGEERNVKLELKLLADVCLVGYPNVGKSTFLKNVTNAKPLIRDYPFATLAPILGVTNLEGINPFVIADLPGLISGAKDGRGLGQRFLKHVERCRLLVHIVDISESENRDSVRDFEDILNELQGFSDELCEKKMIVVGNKLDKASNDQIKKFESYIKNKGYNFYLISALNKVYINNLMKNISYILTKLPTSFSKK
ncbi:MAG: GTPase ObgE [Oscillospiraceae bacterium]|nr:GTPase ObgE [Oscillospiraceae bacterium]